MMGPITGELCETGISAAEGAALKTVGTIAVATATGGPVGAALAIVSLAARALVQAFANPQGRGVSGTHLLAIARAAKQTGVISPADLKLFADWFRGGYLDNMTSAERQEMRPLLALACETYGASWQGWPYCDPSAVASTPRPPWPSHVLTIPAGTRGPWPTGARLAPDDGSKGVKDGGNGTSVDRGNTRFYDLDAHRYLPWSGYPQLTPDQQYIPITKPETIADLWSSPDATGYTTPPDVFHGRGLLAGLKTKSPLGLSWGFLGACGVFLGALAAMNLRRARRGAR